MQAEAQLLWHYQEQKCDRAQDVTVTRLWDKLWRAGRNNRDQPGKRTVTWPKVEVWLIRLLYQVREERESRHTLKVYSVTENMQGSQKR